MVFALQTLSLAHAASYGEEPHEHNGVACDIVVVSSDEAGILPVPLTFDLPVQTTLHIAPQPFTSAAYLAPQGRAPPPRAPPLAHS
jgi:hypothetical protein